MKKILLIGALAISAISLYAKDIQTLVVTTNPPLSCQNCENKIKGNIRFEKGVKNIETSIPDQRVIVTYDADKTSPEKIEEAFAKINYQVKVINENGETEAVEENCCVKEEACCGAKGSCCSTQVAVGYSNLEQDKK